MKLTNILCVAGPPSLFIKTDMFPPLKGHYQGVRTFIQRSTQSNTVMHKQYVIIWQCRCKRCQNVPDVCCLRPDI